MVHGASGCGKTSVMAMTAKHIRNWIPNGKNAVVILRFLGTTPKSSGIIPLLTSICEQIAHNYKAEFKPSDTASDIIQELSNLIQKSVAKKPLVVLLDSLDQLSSAHYAHKLSWLPLQLPENVHVVVSTLPEFYRILPTLRKRIHEDNFVRVQSLGDKLGFTILSEWLKRINRKLTDDQQRFVGDTLKKCSLPLYTRLLYENVALWKSYTEITEIPHSIRGIINALYEKLEVRYGSVFVQHALGYITASKSGLSETELEDILSLDDEVLTEVFQYHVPPVRRIPQLLIVRLRQAIENYVVNREADGVMVVYWYHRQFIEAAQERYLDTPETISNRHKLLADYFLGQWHDRAKPFHYSKAMTKKLGLKNSSSSENRHVAPQPLFFGDAQNFGSPKFVNRRKLSKLPFHLEKAGMLDALLEKCLLNYGWLRVKIESFSLRETLDDFDLEHGSDICNALAKSLNLARSTLPQHPSTLGFEIISRLANFQCSGTFEQKVFKQLLEDCIRECTKENKVLPAQQLFDPVDECLKFELENANIPTSWRAVFVSSETSLLFARLHPNKLAVWDLQTGEIEKLLTLWPEEEPKLDAMDVNYVTNANTQAIALREATHLLFAASHCGSGKMPIVVVGLQSQEIEHALEIQPPDRKKGYSDKIQMSLINNESIIVNARGWYCAIFSLQNGQCIHLFDSRAADMHVLLPSPNILLHVKEPPSLEIHSKITHKMVNSVPLGEGIITKILISTESVYILPKDSNVIQVWSVDGENGKLMQEINVEDKISNGFVFDMMLSTDQRYLLLLHKSGLILWNAKSSKLMRLFKIPSKCVPKYHRVVSFTACFTNDNKYVIAAYEGYTIGWSFSSDNSVAFYKAANDTNRLVELIPVSMSEAQFLVAVIDNVKAYKLLDLKKIIKSKSANNKVVNRMESGVRYLAAAYTSDKIVCRSHNPREVMVYDVAKCQPILTNFQSKEVTRPSISLDGRYILLNTINPMPKNFLKSLNSFSNDNGDLRVYSADTGKMTTSLPVLSMHLRIYCFSQSGNLVLTHCEETVDTYLELTLWKADSKVPSIVKQMDIQKGGVSAMECVYDDRFVLTLHNYSQLDTGNEACDLRVFSVETGKETHHSAGSYHRGTLRAVLNKPYFYVSKTSATPNAGVPMRFDLDTMTLTEIPVLQYGWLFMDLDGIRAIDSHLKVFDLMQGTVIADFGSHTDITSHSDSLKLPKITQDGKFISWFDSHESRVFIGCVDSQSVIGTVFTHSYASPLSMKFCRDHRLAVGCEGGHIMVLDIVENENEAEKACKRLLPGSGKPLRLRTNNGASQTCSVL